LYPFFKDLVKAVKYLMFIGNSERVQHGNLGSLGWKSVSKVFRPRHMHGHGQ